MADEDVVDVSQGFTDRVMRAVRLVEQWMGQGAPPVAPGHVLPNPPCAGFSPAGVAVPAYGVVVSQGTSLRVHNVQQASVHGGGSVMLINGSSDVAAGGQGIGWFAPPWWPQWALYDTSGDTAPSVGESWGVQSGGFKLGRGLPGFTVLEVDSANGRVLVARSEGDNTRTAKLSRSTGAMSATLWYLDDATSLTMDVEDDMLVSGSQPIPQDTMITVQFWPHVPGWKILNASCPVADP